MQWKWRESLTAHFVLKITTGVGWAALLSLQVTSNAMWLVFRSDFMMCHNISKMLWQRCDNLTGFARHMSHKLFLADVERLHPVKEMSIWWFQRKWSLLRKTHLLAILYRSEKCYDCYVPVKAGKDSGPGNPSDDVHPRTSENHFVTILRISIMMSTLISTFFSDYFFTLESNHFN